MLISPQVLNSYINNYFMSTTNIVSIQIPAEVKAAVIAKLGEVREILKPYLVALTPDQRRELPKMGDKSLSFVQKTLGYIRSNPEFAPPFLNVEELSIDTVGAFDLQEVLQLLDPLCADVNDTELLCGSEAYMAALVYYNSVKQAAKLNQPAAKAIYEDLKQRFEAKGAVLRKEKVSLVE